MLNENAYTTKELIHYAGVDDRFKPLLADRVARDGMPEPDTTELDDARREIADLHENALLSNEKDRWLIALESAIDSLKKAQEAKGDDVQAYVSEALGEIQGVYSCIEDQPAVD